MAALCDSLGLHGPRTGKAGSGLSLFAFLVVVRQWCEGIGDLWRAEIAFFKVFGAGGESKRGGGKRDQQSVLLFATRWE